jgi:hypothetical protein
LHDTKTNTAFSATKQALFSATFRNGKSDKEKDDKPKKERADEYDVKLAVNASFAEVFRK